MSEAKKQRRVLIHTILGCYKEIDFTDLEFNLNIPAQRILRYSLRYLDKKTNRIVLFYDLFQVSQPYFSLSIKPLLKKELLIKLKHEKVEIAGMPRRAVYLLNPYFVFPLCAETAKSIFEEWDNIEKK